MQTERRIIGDEAETLVAETLERQGFVIRDRNVICRRGELDIVAEKGVLLAFVEVRMRTSAVWGDPSTTISFSKQRKVVLAALEYLQRHRLKDRALRFDVASVIGRGRSAHVELIPNAFDAGL